MSDNGRVILAPSGMDQARRIRLISQILAGMTAAALPALGLVFLLPSKAENAWLFGYSKTRLALGAALLLFLLLHVALLVLQLHRPNWWQAFTVRLKTYLLARNHLFWCLTFFYLVFIAILVPLAVALLIPIRQLPIFPVVMGRAGSLLTWILLACAGWTAILILSFRDSIHEHWLQKPGKLWTWALPFLGLLVYCLQVAVEISGQSLRDHLYTSSAVLAGILLLWGGINLALRTRKQSLKGLNQLFMAVAIALVVYVALQCFALSMDWVKTPRMAYWHLLAKSILEGKPYLIDPAEVHDLSLFRDNWYIPMYPMPAFVFIPYVLFVEPAQVNTVLISIFFTALNGVLVYSILERMQQKGWISLSRSGMLWLVALFVFGTPLLYVGVVGWVWFLTQTLTLTFLALALLCALQCKPAWLSGLCLGAAVAARPNVILLWVLLMAVTVQSLSTAGGMRGKWKQVITWAAGSLLPVGLVGIGLLIYNYLRFGDALDFGYAYMVGSRSIVADIQQYGVLGFRYVPRNLETMFLTRPLLSIATYKLIPSQVGMSMFLTTPALFLLIGRYEKKWWIVGAWSAILLSVIFLSLFHNTGASQFGYRYVLDFILPILMLLATVVSQRKQWLLRAAILLSMGINLLGASWYFRSVLGS